MVGHCTNRPWLREKDLNLRPLGYEPNELPDCSIPRYSKVGGGKGIRTPAPLARPPGFQDRSLQPDLGIPPDWCLRSDLNRHEGLFSQDFKSCASTYSATQAFKIKNGVPCEIRTHDPLIKSQMLYLLS